MKLHQRAEYRSTIVEISGKRKNSIEINARPQSRRNCSESSSRARMNTSVGELDESEKASITACTRTCAFSGYLFLSRKFYHAREKRVRLSRNQRRVSLVVRTRAACDTVHAKRASPRSLFTLFSSRFFCGREHRRILFGRRI